MYSQNRSSAKMDKVIDKNIYVCTAKLAEDKNRYVQENSTLSHSFIIRRGEGVIYNAKIFSVNV
jgi:hypothetical protein